MHWLRGPTSCVGRKATSPLLRGRGGGDFAGVGARGMRAGGFPGNPGGLVVSILKTAGVRAPAHQARGRGRSTWRPTERSCRCSDGTATRRQRSAGGWTARSRSASYYRRSGGIEPTRPRGGKGAPADGPVGGTDGQHAEVGFRLNETTTDSRAGQGRTGDGVHELGSPHRHACAPCGIRSNAEGRGGGTGRTDGGRLRGASGGEPAVTARPLQVRPVCSASRATRPHPERGWPEDSTHRDSDVRGQGAAAGRCDGAGECLRAGLPGL